MRRITWLMVVAGTLAACGPDSTSERAAETHDASSVGDASPAKQPNDAGFDAGDAETATVACANYARVATQPKSTFSFVDTACDPACTDGAIFRYETRRVTDRPALDQDCWQKLDAAGGATTSWCCPKLECTRDFDAQRNDACGYDPTHPFAFLCSAPAEQARPSRAGCVVSSDGNASHVCCTKDG